MNNIINILQAKIKRDKNKLIVYRFLDWFFSILIAILNITLISIAIYTLVNLIHITNLHKKNPTEQYKIDASFYLLIALVILIITSLMLTIVLAVYKQNTNQATYKKLYSTLKYVQTKYEANKITYEQYQDTIEQLYQRAKYKNKFVIKKIVKDEMVKWG
ncbi:hypothetical protein GE118_02345 [Mycoplasma sp. NEAQ87857]|uniref:hypothetical protein n=1 Tax=Mycoplasma sp. NEAQ87857 TaxID=2683967 RepID=UPI0013162A79|nr:hypothetical protein [Mycoplasma sp. NEAQ87857]QGZ97634.1 hypothetical protein GE118_02345 [Mycoplasma sp. NEAQ87857]